jgi:hypothetical protein
MSEADRLLLALVLDFIRASQRDAMRSKACCKAVLHLVESLSAEEFNEKVRLMKIWVG